VGIESTVLSLVDAPTLLRPGAISIGELESLIGPILRGAAPAEGAHAGPGMHARHYRPATPLYLDTVSREGKGSVLRIGREMPADPRAYAAVLYETLHRLDTLSLDWIAIEPPPDTAEWAAILDRLRRAAT
jgi:L-threonylcarbamoyladenylate synthase